MCDKRNKIITQAVLDVLASGAGIYTAEGGYLVGKQW